MQLTQLANNLTVAKAEELKKKITWYSCTRGERIVSVSNIEIVDGNLLYTTHNASDEDNWETDYCVTANGDVSFN